MPDEFDPRYKPTRTGLQPTGTPGTIVGRIGVDKARVDSLSIDCGGADVGITVARKLTFSHVSVTNCSSYGILRTVGPANLRATDLTVTDCGIGIEPNLGRLKSINVTVSGNSGAGVYAGKASLVGVTAVGNGTWGVSAARTVTIRGGAITGNGEAGVVVPEGRAKVRDADVTGNGTDIASSRRPAVVNTTCGTSRMIVDGVITPDSWAVCPGE